MIGKNRTKIWVVALSNNYEASLPYRLSTYKYCNNAECVILQNWDGWISKLEELSKFLSGNCDDSDVVVFSDAHDFVFIKDIEHIAEDFFDSDKDIIFGAEKRCAHHTPEAKLAFDSASDSEFRYLNSGMIIATAKNLRRALKMILPYEDRTVIDQTLWGKLFAARRPDLKIGLDYDRKFVHTANSITPEDPSPATPYAIHVTWQENQSQAEKFSRVLKCHDLFVEQNRKVFYNPDTVKEYEKRDHLYPAEETFVAHYASQIAKSRVLDLGVGAGRTTQHLLARCRSYRAIDYSSEMIRACRRKFPECGPEVFGLGDARDLSAEPEQGYDLVLFSDNGLDMVDHTDRLRVLSEVHRVLSPNGLFFFSAHSLYAFPFADEEIRNRNRDVDPDLLQKRGWALLRDARLDVINYYSYPERQRKELWHAGFEVIEILDMDGMPFKLSKPAKDWMLHYVCRPRRALWRKLIGLLTAVRNQGTEKALR